MSPWLAERVAHYQKLVWPRDRLIKRLRQARAICVMQVHERVGKLVLYRVRFSDCSTCARCPVADELRQRGLLTGFLHHAAPTCKVLAYRPRHYGALGSLPIETLRPGKNTRDVLLV